MQHALLRSSSFSFWQSRLSLSVCPEPQVTKVRTLAGWHSSSDFKRQTRRHFYSCCAQPSFALVVQHLHGSCSSCGLHYQPLCFLEKAKIVDSGSTVAGSLGQSHCCWFFGPVTVISCLCIVQLSALQMAATVANALLLHGKEIFISLAFSDPKYAPHLANSSLRATALV